MVRAWTGAALRSGSIALIAKLFCRGIPGQPGLPGLRFARLIVVSVRAHYDLASVACATPLFCPAPGRSPGAKGPRRSPTDRSPRRFNHRRPPAQQQVVASGRLSRRLPPSRSARLMADRPWLPISGLHKIDCPVKRCVASPSHVASRYRQWCGLQPTFPEALKARYPDRANLSTR